MSDTPARWEPPSWMLPHLEALGMTQQASNLMNGPRADVGTNPVLAVLQQSMADRIQLLRTLHGTRRLLPNRHDYEGHTVVHVQHWGPEATTEDVLALASLPAYPDEVIVFRGVTTISPAPAELDKDGC